MSDDAGLTLGVIADLRLAIDNTQVHIVVSGNRIEVRTDHPFRAGLTILRSLHGARRATYVDVPSRLRLIKLLTTAPAALSSVGLSLTVLGPHGPLLHTRPAPRANYVVRLGSGWAHLVVSVGGVTTLLYIVRKAVKSRSKQNFRAQ